MTPPDIHALAEKIVKDFPKNGEWEDNEIVALESLLSEAMEEAIDKAIAERMTMPTDEVHKLQQEILDEAKAEAYEEAAKIISEWGCSGEACCEASVATCCEALAEQIRQRMKEFK